jgi:excisionase family DNA binding protein
MEEKVIIIYTKAANTTIAPHQGWHHFQIPQLNANIVTKELLTIQEVAEALNQQESDLMESLAKSRLSAYNIGNTSLIRRKEIDSYLSRNPINGCLLIVDRGY